MVINHYLSASSIFYDSWHPLCSIYMPNSLFPQSLSKFSLVYLLTWHPPLHIAYISTKIIYTKKLWEVWKECIRERVATGMLEDWFVSSDELLFGTKLSYQHVAQINTNTEQCFDAVGWAVGRASACKKLTGGVLAWLFCLGEVQICVWPSSCHYHPLSLAPVNPDWFHLPGFTFLVPDHPSRPGRSPGAVKRL